MYPEYGLIALVFAGAVAILQVVLPLWGVRTANRTLADTSLPLTVLFFALILISYLYLTLSFLIDDYSVAYVASNSNSMLPWYYKLSAVWGAHEGSMLLWVLVLAGWSLAVAVLNRSLAWDFRATVLAVQGFLALGFVAFLIFTSNPFERLLPFAPADGQDLNPLLQDPGLIFHPPLLYMGYVGFSVAFSFAVATLLLGRVQDGWADWLRPWTNVAWLFLTLGITLGSWWAYYELGWGGWWFWDPVENASLLPWILGTALVHSLAVARKRGLFQSWTLLLAIFAFSLSLLGTFLVRSGVLTSVHAFASDPERGLYILLFLGLVIGASLSLFAVRVGDLNPQKGFKVASRETGLLVNNLLLTFFTAIVLLGTLYPLAVEVTGRSVSVGPPWFNLFLLITAVPLLLALGIGQRLRWRSDDFARVAAMIPLPLVLSVGISLVICWVQDAFHPLLILCLVLALWIVLHLVADLVQRLRSGGAKWSFFTAGWVGMATAHIGVAVLAVGIGMTATRSVELDVRMTPGTLVEVGGYEFRLQGVYVEQGPNYVADVADIFVWRNGVAEALMYPEKRRYLVRGDVLTEAGIHGNLWRDLYVSMGESLGGDAWAMRIQVKPFMRWVWFGAVLMALGALIAMFERKNRAPMVREAHAG